MKSPARAAQSTSCVHVCVLAYTRKSVWVGKDCNDDHDACDDTTNVLMVVPVRESEMQTASTITTPSKVQAGSLSHPATCSWTSIPVPSSRCNAWRPETQALDRNLTPDHFALLDSICNQTTRQTVLNCFIAHATKPHARPFCTGARSKCMERRHTIVMCDVWFTIYWEGVTIIRCFHVKSARSKKYETQGHVLRLAARLHKSRFEISSLGTRKSAGLHTIKTTLE